MQKLLIQIWSVWPRCINYYKQWPNQKHKIIWSAYTPRLWLCDMLKQNVWVMAHNNVWVSNMAAWLTDLGLINMTNISIYSCIFHELIASVEYSRQLLIYILYFWVLRWLIRWRRQLWCQWWAENPGSIRCGGDFNNQYGLHSSSGWHDHHYQGAAIQIDHLSTPPISCQNINEDPR